MKQETNMFFESLFRRIPALNAVREEIGRGFHLLEDCHRSGGKLLIAGNGGSAADSGHIVGEMMKGFLLTRPMPPHERQRFLSALDEADAEYLIQRLQRGIPAFSLACHTELISAVMNDNGVDLVFAQQIFACGRKEDLALLLSTSGNSMNIVRAAQTARALGMTSLAITGSGGGRLGVLCDCTIALPANSTPDIQELTLPVYHTLCAMAEAEFFGTEESA